MKKFLSLLVFVFLSIGMQSAIADNISMYSSNLYIVGITPTSYNSPGSEGATNAFDGNPYTKYLNFDKTNAGVTVELNQGRVVNSFTVTTANDFAGRDPTSYKLYGSNSGSSWVLIQEGNLALSDSRYTTSSSISVNNTAPYVYYFMVFPTTKAGTGCGQNCNSMQIGELTYQYDPLNTASSTKSSGGSISNPGTSGSTVSTAPAAPTGPTVEGGTITQTNAPTNQTITSGGGSSAGITPAQQTRINMWINSNSAGNLLYIDQVGDNNAVTILQEGNQNKIELTANGNSNIIDSTQVGSNYIKTDVTGNQNSITTTQSISAGSNYAETKILGSGNIVNHTQSNNANKLLFNAVTGNNNTVTTTQTGTGAHYAETKITGNGNSVLVDQSGSTANKATIDITNAGGAASVDLQQTGGKNFSIIQSCTNPAGCTTVVRQ